MSSARVAALILGATFIASGRAAADFVIADDLIVQGSACVGLDCVNNEPFGFDTLRLKENNTRILFMDTSVGTFPSNDWQLTANDSASGGANKFSIEDITGARVPFTVIAGAPTNSMFVDSNGKVGLRTATPVLDVHVNTSDTPAHRFEQNNSGGFTAQTWDVAGNEANFFVRDVTGGSRLPFRIRPGAPTSSIDINASGNVGVGTASPQKLVHVSGSATSTMRLQDTSASSNIGEFTVTGDFVGLGANRDNTSGAVFNPGKASASIFMRAAAGDSFVLFGTTPTNNTGPSERMRIDKDGNVGIGTTAPAARLHTTGSVRLAGVPNCTSGIQSNASGDLSCLVSSRQFKTITGDLTPSAALANVMALRPQTGSYKETPDVPEHWLIAEDVATVDPALVGLSDGKPYTVKTQNIVADLVAVVQQQQRRIDELERRLAAK